MASLATTHRTDNAQVCRHCFQRVLRSNSFMGKTMPVDANGEKLIEIYVRIFRSVNDGARTPVFTLIRAAFADRQFEESGQAVVMHARSRLARLYENNRSSCLMNRIRRSPERNFVR